MLLEKAQFILNQAKKAGATAAEVAITQDQGFTISVRDGDVETIEYHADREASITVYFDHRKASSSTTDTSNEALSKAVDAACSIVKHIEPDPYAGLVEPCYLAKSLPELDLYYPWKIEPTEAIDLLCNMEQEAFNQHNKIKHSDGAGLGTFTSEFIYANTHGFAGGGKSSIHEVSLSLIAEEKSQMERDYSYTIARDARDLETPSWIAKEAVKRTIERLGARPLSTCKAPVIFSAEVARSLIGNFLSAISGTQLYRKASFLVDSLGTPVFSSHINIHEEPHLKKGFGSAAFDSDGVATKANSIIKQGILQQYLLGAYSARRLNMTPTGNADGVHNLIVEHDDISLHDLIKKMHKGLLVTELMGQGVNLLTGDYSRGIAGFWVENGVIQYPVTEVTIAGNLKDMLANLVSISNDVDTRGNIRTGSILLTDMTIAGT